MIVQIYTFQSVEEANNAVNLGVDHIGLTPSNKNLPGEISCEKAREIADSIGKRAKTVALSVDEDLEKILHMVEVVQPDILHLCAEFNTVPPKSIAELRKQLPPQIAVLQAIPVGFSREAVQHALDYQDVADMLILDSVTTDVQGIGASGATHDWNISREIVQTSRIPVILAGGLSADNVSEAIRVVRPWGVDSLSHTNKKLPAGGFCKDMELIETFVKNIRSTVQECAGQ